jgi:thioester reductase-like protein
MVALVKTLLMIHEGTIAPQASHDAINPALNASESDKIEISTHLKPWNAQFKAALINNYGASGSNASMIVTEPPRRAKGTNDADTGRSPHQPFWVCGTDDQSLRAYASSLVSFLRSKKFSARDVSLSNLSFSLARQSNRSLPRGLIFHSPTIQDLEGQLLAFSQGGRDALDIEKASPPVILCFGGQVSTFVGLDRQVVERITVFKRHLDQCNIICKAMGLQGIYPEIFQREPIENIVKLQTALFALQYSCAMSWIECGVQVAAVVGHSFGEIVAHTVAGALTLADGLKIIARRARIIRDSWESDRGSMMAVEADVETVERVLARANGSLPSDRPATIACFNGPRSFTLAGSSASIQTVEAVLADDKALSASIRFKKLRTSHAFHSTLVETTLPDLEKVTEGIVFSEPRIHVETATEAPGTRPLSSTYIAEHLRQPVYFNHAIQRLGKQHSGAIWLEAGSQSTVTNMAAKALGMPPSSHFQPMNLTTDAAWQHLTEATVALWKRGLHVDFWPHHSSQTAQYPPLILPPYQFEKSRHFLDLKQPEPFSIKHSISDDQPLGLWSFVEYRGPGKQCARFRINTGHNTFQELMAGHTVAHSQPLCPSTLQLDIATESIRSLCPEFPISDFQLDLRDLENPSPLCRDHSRDVWLDATPLNSRQTWSWRIVSNPLGSDSGETLHASGRVLFRSRNDAEFLNEFGRFERLVTHKRCQEMLKGTDADDVIQGSAIYKLFADVVDYSEVFRGVRKVVGRENESAGRVVKKYSNDTWLDTPLCDSFCQVAGVFVNCMTQRPDGDACISTGVERVVRSPFIRNFEDTPEVFDVFALHERPTDRSFSSDVFIFDSRTSQLLGVILGIQYQRVSKLAMAKLLARLTPGAEQPRAAVTAFHPKSENVDPAPVENTSAPPAAADTGSSVKAKLLAVLTEMVGVDPSKITDSTNLPDLGIDSLMGMEIARELELAFKCTFDSSSLMALVEFGDLVNCVRSAVGAGEDAESVPAVEAGHARTVVENADPSTASSSPPLSVAGFDETALPSDTDMSSRSASPKPDAKIAARQDAIEYFVGKYSKDFAFPSKRTGTVQCQTPPRCCVLITGATGSLGAHLVERFANLESVATVICFNRPSNMDPLARQHQALSERGIQLDEKASSKLHVISSDTSKPLLGLEETAYEKLVQEVTHIIHNAWPMSITRSISDFEKQFMAMRNLIDLARDASYKLPSSSKVGFQFISSIATVGLYPVVTGKTIVDEEPTSVQYALPSGYSDAKLVCEKLLSKTLLANGHRDRTDAMVVRVGQVAGSRTSGYWNPAEHLSLLVKSSKTLNAIPNLPGELSWLPVNDVAATLADLVLTPSPSQHESGVYHVENPTRQPWAEVVSLLAKELQIDQVIPYEEWLERVKEIPKEGTKENPAIKVITFLEKEFVRMACGGIVLGTEKARERSETLRTAGAIERDTIARFVRRWRESGFLA